RKQKELENRRFERAGLRSVADPQEIAMRTQVIQSLENLLPRIDASRRVYAACVERRDAVAHEKATLDSTLKGIRPPSQPAFVAFILLMWAAAAGLYGVSQPYVAASLIAVSLLPLLWYRSRIRKTENAEKKFRECASRFSACQQELNKTEDEAREI